MKKENIFTHKFLPILSILILISFIFINNCFAYSEEFTYNDTNYIYYIPEGAYNSFLESEQYKSGKYNYLLSCDNGTCRIYFWLKTQDVKIYQTTKDNYYNSNISDYGCLYYTVSENGGNLSLQNSNATSFHNSAYSSGNKIYMFTNVTVYTDSSCSKVFFYQPVQVVTIPALETAEQVPEAMRTALKMIIPVGLIVLSMVLLIYLIKSVISRMR